MKKKHKGSTKKPSKKNGATSIDLAYDLSERSRPAAVNYKDFVKLWVKAESVGAVAAAFGLKTTSASAIANRLRKAGVALKRFPRSGAQSIDAKALNRIAAGKAD